MDRESSRVARAPLDGRGHARVRPRALPRGRGVVAQVPHRRVPRGHVPLHAPERPRRRVRRPRHGVPPPDGSPPREPPVPPRPGARRAREAHRRRPEARVQRVDGLRGEPSLLGRRPGRDTNSRANDSHDQVQPAERHRPRGAPSRAGQIFGTRRGRTRVRRRGPAGSALPGGRQERDRGDAGEVRGVDAGARREPGQSRGRRVPRAEILHPGGGGGGGGSDVRGGTFGDEGDSGSDVRRRSPLGGDDPRSDGGHARGAGEESAERRGRLLRDGEGRVGEPAEGGARGARRRRGAPWVHTWLDGPDARVSNAWRRRNALGVEGGWDGGEEEAEEEEETREGPGEGG